MLLTASFDSFGFGFSIGSAIRMLKEEIKKATDNIATMNLIIDLKERLIEVFIISQFFGLVRSHKDTSKKSECQVLKEVLF